MGDLNISWLSQATPLEKGYRSPRLTNFNMLKFIVTQRFCGKNSNASLFARKIDICPSA